MQLVRSSEGYIRTPHPTFSAVRIKLNCSKLPRFIMIFSSSVTALLALSVASLAKAQLKYNLTLANAPGNFEKYKCL